MVLQGLRVSGKATHAFTTWYTALIFPPGIVAQPQSQSVHLGATASFSVGVNGTAPFAYRWRLNGYDVPGATGPSLIVPNAQFTHAGGYTVQVTNAAGSATSAIATLSVLGYTNRIMDIGSVTGYVGGTVSLPVQLLAMGGVKMPWHSA
jgi:hypothetical protein